MEMLIWHIQNGGTLDDLFLLSVREPIEWDRAGQFWFVKLRDEEEWGLVKVGGRVALSSGRGGAAEEAVVAEDLGDGKYKLDVG